MVFVPGAHFQPGNSRQAVDLSGFWIDKTEVTNESYKKFINTGGYQNEKYWSTDGWKWVQGNHITQPLFWSDSRYNAPQQPVVGVSWWEANAYATWAGKRLPKDNEWELAARGTDGRRWPWGNEWDETKANAYEGSAGNPLPVASFSAGASPYGALDMAGNVWEWTSDWYRQRPVNRNQTKPDDKVLKGSSWDQGFGEEQRCLERRQQAELRYPSGGFRTVAELSN
jgi:formylglycine-generating enzyme required for sulfatase activity